MLETVLCACGSGLRNIRCCGLDPAALPTPASLEILGPLVAEATRLFNEKKPRDAENLVLKILDLAPNQRIALRILYQLRKAEHRNPATEMLARRLAGLPTGNSPQATAANLQLAQLLIGQGRHAEAEPAARIALKSSPRDPTSHHVLGVIFTEIGRLQQGERHYRRALELLNLEFRAGGSPGREADSALDRETGTMLANLAWNLKLQGRLEDAAASYERALELRPDNARAIGGYAQLEAARGNKPHAATLLDDALTRWPADRNLRLLRALTDLALNDPDAVLTRLNDPPEALLPAELTARGRAFERLGQTSEALTAYATAKSLQRDRYGQRYQAAPWAEKARRYKTFFTSGQLAVLPRAGIPKTPQPIFLLGFPGSGTSLLEQLLAHLPGIAAADELAPIAHLTTSLELANYPDCLADTLIGDRVNLPDLLATRHIEALAAMGISSPAPQFVTSRSASDVWHLGLIKLLFPGAPIIHVIRHPLDVVITNFTRDRQVEANCAISILSSAQHYDLTMSLVRHYRSQLTLRYLPVRYEDLVNDPAGTLRTVLNFIGLTEAIPTESILRANQPGPAARTPSHGITQEPIHARGLFRYLAFEAVAPTMFTEIRPILAPWIGELGYAL